MGTPYLGEIKMVSFNFPPRGWALCNGAILAIQSNQALFALFGTTYGGDGIRTFALPNLQGRSPVYVGQGIVQGELGGEVNHTLAISELSAHTHVPVGGSPANLAVATGSLPGKGTSANFYAGSPNTAMNPATVLPVGGSQPHNNMQPYTVITFIVALQGAFPSRN
jgi:microcystin-dependent protein